MTNCDAGNGEMRLALCSRCYGYSWPHTAWGCRACGADAAALTAVALPQPARLLNLVAVHAPLAPGLEVPVGIGEVELAPGLIEEAWVEGIDASAFEPGQRVGARRIDGPAGARWCFGPEERAT